jgi:D-glycero-alpha-D-manno-heptose 1-phosphate guanylyltransferase
MISECIILAGGLGTRLRSVVNEVPKVMAPVNEEPFLYYLIKRLREQNIQRIIFATGYKHEIIANWVKDSFPESSFQFSIEEEPLGTGGAIRKAMEMAVSEDVLVLNGDSYLEVDYSQLLAFHQDKKADATLVLKSMKNFDRYGCVETDNTGRITAFLEKEYRAEGLINAGVYLLNRNRFLSHSFPEKFSMEKEYLEENVQQLPLYGFTTEGYFIDIGIPEDFARAQIDFKNK